MTAHILIVGAGAIGRGFLPWVLERDARLTFVDRDPRIVDGLRARGGYTTHRARDGALQALRVEASAAHTTDEARARDWGDVDLAFVAVGPRNVQHVAHILSSVGGPVVLCENDPATVDVARAATGRDDIWFAIPDVITSNTAPDHLLATDPLAMVTEDGVLFVHEGVGIQPGDWRACDQGELDTQWTAKLYLHNTPHCVAAYLGSRVGARFVHESMAHTDVASIVRGSMNEMLQALKLRWEIPHDFLDWYADKELARFSNVLLHDPISRVAREPLRKLQLDGRLIGAARICLSHGLLPHNILLGIASALLFDDPRDADNQLQFLREALAPEDLLSIVLGLTRGEALELLLRDQLPNLEERIAMLPRNP